MRKGEGVFFIKLNKKQKSIPSRGTANKSSINRKIALPYIAQ
jgi:hypothetical protein